jgi:hypothetical protein
MAQCEEEKGFTIIFHLLIRQTNENTENCFNYPARAWIHPPCRGIFIQDTTLARHFQGILFRAGSDADWSHITNNWSNKKVAGSNIH